MHVSTEYYSNDKIHRQKVFDRDGNLHNDVKPALIEYYKSGRVKRYEFYQRNKLHRENNAAIEVFSEDGRVHLELHYYHYGLRHRGSPSCDAAIIYSNEKGHHVRQEFWHMGLRHRKFGPAIMIRDPNTLKVVEEEFYRHGEKVDAVVEESFMQPEKK